jgi:hypothetical protein
MKLTIKEKKYAQATEEGRLGTALAGLGAASALATAGMASRDYSAEIDRISAIETKIMQVQGPKLADAYEKATGHQFRPRYGNYKGELRAAVAGLIASGKLDEKELTTQK